MRTVLLILFNCLVLATFAQSDSLQETLTKDNIYCLYQVDKIYTDPNRTAIREVNGAVNFIEIINGGISVVARSPNGSYVQSGTIEAVYTKMVDGNEVMFVETVADWTNGTGRCYIFDFSIKDQNTVLVHSRRKRTQEHCYFECHVATAEEKAAIRKYFDENSPK